ncbi:hypothetical protein B0H11DRAFT_2284643 [Mycena galericulata]|nr:hypothetical protein B0H11DRAFT_2284643 [Mycena galericulata]
MVKLNPANNLAKLFGPEASGYVATALDVFENSSTSKNEEPMVHESLAPSFGSLDNAAQSVRELDDKMKLMIAVSMKELLKYKQQGALSWKNIQGCFNANTTLVAMEEPQEITQQYVSETSADFKFDGSPDPNLVQKVMHWWQSEACPDPDIRADSHIDVESLAKIVAWSGATVTNFVNVFSKHERHERRMLEVGVMRFPSIANPYFKIYRIQIFAWSDCSRIFFHQEDKNGMQTVVTSQRFRPNDEVLNKVKAETMQKAVSEVDDMFS